MFVNGNRYRRPPRLAGAAHPRRRQHGVVLMVALIILVAMTLAGVALIRSVDTGNVIAGNLAFHQAATNAGERSTQLAMVNWLAPGSAPNVSTLDEDKAEQGYVASRVDPAAGVSWDAFWNALQIKKIAAPTGGICPSDANADIACNKVEYVIHRLCATNGKPNTVNNPCTQPPPGASSGSSQSVGNSGNLASKQVYYRITTRIEGPRRTVSYIQTIVAM
ncbi:MAG TPA: hypothetical protein PLS67_11660 [Accumulibacter sp.]|jgi:Tfp pilus assembly protein PilX|nr:hypothetical protein [Accumulibacter sp.]HQC81151.1 hypothetical protein [Accumulibacter sp.]